MQKKLTFFITNSYGEIDEIVICKTENRLGYKINLLE